MGIKPFGYKDDCDEHIKDKSNPPSTISVGVTWVDGRIIFKPDKKWGMAWYGICHFSKGVFAISPLDYAMPTMITTIRVSAVEGYCERAHSCLNKKCPLNQFTKEVFLSEFKDLGEGSLALPRAMGKGALWFSEGKWEGYWRHLIIPITGGTLNYDEERDKR